MALVALMHLGVAHLENRRKLIALFQTRHIGSLNTLRVFMIRWSEAISFHHKGLRTLHRPPSVLR